jgi:galactose mutarotase-like enzyme
VYPFEFRLSLTHALEGHVLTVETVVDNLGAEPMPFGLGYHPAFVWPLPGAEGKPHMVSLENAAEPGLSTLEGGLRNSGLFPSPFKGGHLVLDHALFADDALVFPEGAGDVLTYAAEGGPTLRFRFENLPNLALWTKPGAPFLCVEPWHGTAPMVGDGDALETRPFTMTLEPGGSARFAFSVEFPL